MGAKRSKSLVLIKFLFHSISVRLFPKKFFMKHQAANENYYKCMQSGVTAYPSLYLCPSCVYPSSLPQTYSSQQALFQRREFCIFLPWGSVSSQLQGTQFFASINHSLFNLLINQSIKQLTNQLINSAADLLINTFIYLIMNL